MKTDWLIFICGLLFGLIVILSMGIYYLHQPDPFMTKVGKSGMIEAVKKGLK